MVGELTFADRQVTGPSEHSCRVLELSLTAGMFIIEMNRVSSVA